MRLHWMAEHDDADPLGTIYRVHTTEHWINDLSYYVLQIDEFQEGGAGMWLTLVQEDCVIVLLENEPAAGLEEAKSALEQALADELQTRTFGTVG